MNVWQAFVTYFKGTPTGMAHSMMVSNLIRSVSCLVMFDTPWFLFGLDAHKAETQMQRAWEVERERDEEQERAGQGQGHGGRIPHREPRSLCAQES